MATINLGSIKFKWKGTYAGGTSYTIDDVVEYNGSSYICILASTGNLPTNTTYFEQMSSAGTNGTDLTSTLTTQGDIVYRDASGLQRLGAGTAGQLLQSGGTGANVSWTDAPEGKLKQIVNGYYANGASSWTTTSSSFVDTPMTFNITPTSTSSKILVVFNTNGSWSSSTGDNIILTIKRDIGGTVTDLGAGSVYALVHTYNPYPVQSCVSKVDAPNTTSQITYTLQVKADGGTAYAFRENSQNTYYAMEIA